MPKSRRSEGLPPAQARDFQRYLEMARGLPWEAEQLPACELHGAPLSGEAVGALWAQAVRAGSFGGGLGLYCHIPFCASRCGYCHCFSDALKRPDELSDHLRLLLTEISLWGPTFARSRFTNAYIGGGTPTLLPPKGLALLLGAIRSAFRFTDDAQITVESTPRTADANRLAVLRAHDVRRLSLGVQSLDRAVLARADRQWQTFEMVERACLNARRAGFPIVNADLIAGLHGQSVASLIADAQAVARLGFDTIHVYYFEPNKGAYDGRGRLGAAWRRRRQAMLAAVGPALAPYGYRAIFGETIYALREGAENRYDFERYFRAGSILGLGWQAESHAFPGTNYRHLSRQSWQESLRAGRMPPVRSYRGGPDWEMREFLVFRLRQGVDYGVFRRLFGCRPQDAFPAAFRALRRAGRLRERTGFVQAVFGSQLEYLAVTLHFFPEESLLRALSMRPSVQTDGGRESPVRRGSRPEA